MPSSRIAFVFCVEPGVLEHQARLLVESLRRWSALDAAELLAYQPRGARPLAAETLAAFHRNGVHYRSGHFNREDAKNPYASKIHVAAHAEAGGSHDIVAFLDTDTVVLSRPEALLLRHDTEAAARPVVKQFAGTTGLPRDPNEDWWRRLYAAAGTDPPPAVATVLDGLHIRAYYNGGLLVFRTAHGFGRRWQRMARLAKPIIPPRYAHNLDQISFALAAAASRLRIEVLPPTYNYPINRRPYIPGVAPDLAELVHIHYHEAFHVPGFLGAVRPVLDPCDERYRWLEEHLPLLPHRSARAVEARRTARGMLAASRSQLLAQLRNLQRQVLLSYP